MTRAVPMSRPALLKCRADGIPEALRVHKRWALWAAVWDARRGKYDKVPRAVGDPSVGLSSAFPDRWASFAEASQCLVQRPDARGLGYCMTSVHGIVGIDLDRCVSPEGKIATWAQEVVDQLDSYTEMSPSGTGLRVFVQGEIDADWTNHTRGIEVYGGHTARFLTVTGRWLPDTSPEVKPVKPEVLQALAARYAKAKPTLDAASAVVMPTLVDERLLPDIQTLALPEHALRFLTDGPVPSDDRSGALHAAGVSLYAAGLDDTVVFSLLVHNEHAMAVALDHRGRDPDRALTYLWREHCVKARAKAADRVASPDEFDVVSDDPAKLPRFDQVEADDFSEGAAPSWIIKTVLPQSELVVLFGESGSGKSFVALDLCMAVARGAPWRGHRTKQGRVVYIAAEGGGGFRKRLKAYAVHHGLSLKGVPMGIIHATPNFLLRQDAVDVAKSVKAKGPTSLIVIDTLAQVTPGANENSSDDMGLALAHCRALHRATGATVVLIHHAGKDTTKGARGWSGLRAAADAEIEVVKSPGGRLVRITKQKDGDDMGAWGFDLHVVSLGVDEDGDPITSCVAVEAALPVVDVVQSAGGRYGKWAKLAQQVVGEIALGQTSGIEVDHVVSEMVRRSDPPEEGKRDRRKERSRRALESLGEGDDALWWIEDGCLEVL